MGRSVPFRQPAQRGRKAGPRQRARIRASETDAPHPRSQPQRALRPRDHDRDGRTGAFGFDPAAGIRLRRGQSRLLRADGARDRTRRLRLPLGDERAVVAGHASDLRIRLGGTAPEIPAQAGDGGNPRLLRPDRARLRLRRRRHEVPGRESRRRLRAQRQQDVDFQFPHRRYLHHLGQAGRRHPRLYSRERHGRPHRTQDRGQDVAPRQHHRRGGDG